MQCRRYHALGVLSAVVLSAAATAQVQVFARDLTGFRAAAGDPPVVVDFDRIASGTDLTGLRFAGITLQGPGARLIVVRGSDTFTPAGFSGAPSPATNRLIPGSGDRLLSPGGPELAPGSNPAIEDDDLVIRFDLPVAAFGLDHASQSADGFSFTGVRVYSLANQLLYSGTVPITNLGGGGAAAGTDFWGVVSSTMNIARIEFDEGDNNAQYPDCNVGYDSFRYFSLATIQPETTDLGGACGGAPPHLLVGLAVLGTTVPITLAGSTAQQTGWLLVSLPPSAPLPLGSCTLHTVDWSVLASIATDGVGAWSGAVPVPSELALAGLPLVIQGIVFGTAGPFGIDLSNGVSLRVGY